MGVELKRLAALAAEMLVSLHDLRVKRAGPELFIATGILRGPGVQKRFSVRHEDPNKATTALYGMCVAHLLAVKERLALEEPD